MTEQQRGAVRLLTILLLFFVGIFLVIFLLSLRHQRPTSTPVKHEPLVTTEASAAACHMHGRLPDPGCTPGAVDPNVSQATIQETICATGYTKQVRPPSQYTSSLKLQQIQAYGFTDTSPRDYEEDHLISLELGGAPSDPKNLWPEPGANPNAKDKVENELRSLVCQGTISLTDAQHRIATDWTTALSGL